jgi:hypothetical protein
LLKEALLLLLLLSRCRALTRAAAASILDAQAPAAAFIAA